MKRKLIQNLRRFRRRERSEREGDGEEEREGEGEEEGEGGEEGEWKSSKLKMDYARAELKKDPKTKALSSRVEGERGEEIVET